MFGYEWSLTVTLKVLTALGPLIIGGVVAYIAWRQWQTAKDKLAVDLFDRRLIAYKGLIKAVEDREQEISKYQPMTQAALFADLVDMEPDSEASTAFYRSQTEVQFLFGMDVYVKVLVLWKCLEREFKASRKVDKEGMEHFMAYSDTMNETRAALVEFRKACRSYMMLDRIGKSAPSKHVRYGWKIILQRTWAKIVGRFTKVERPVMEG